MAILLTGATGYTGSRLLRRLLDATTEGIRALARQPSALPAPVEVRCVDLEEACPADVFDDVDVVYHLAHVRFTAPLLAHVPSTVSRVVVVSSLRALSTVPDETVDQVLAGEAAARACPVPWTVLRPSMIFGDGDDRNISRLVQRVRAGGWIPVMGADRLHQPVWVEDVLDAILAAGQQDSALKQTYAIAGAEPLTWACLLDEIGAVVGRPARRLPLPGAPVAAALRLLERLGLRAPVRAAQVRRLLEDKAVDIGAARRDLAYEPATFGEALRRIHGAVHGAVE
jgi:uncharacterized protein YbjT (DUF2867 family)